jgi:pimeloyl-ACP methyl ester carboxylesterase
MRNLVLDVSGGRLLGECHDADGPVLLALHAGVADQRSWRDVVAILDGAVTVVTYDRRGYGQTLPSGSPFSHLEDLLRVLGRLGDDPIWVLGNSRGGSLALDAALTLPTRIAGLVLLAPAISGAPELPLDAATASLDAQVEQAFSDGDGAEANRLETWLWLDGPSSPEGRVGGAARELALDMNSTVIYNEDLQRGLELKSDVNAWRRLEEIAVPARVACGALDVPAIVENSRALAERLPRGEFELLPEVAHLPSVEAPSLVADLVARALSL